MSSGQVSSGKDLKPESPEGVEIVRRSSNCAAGPDSLEDNARAKSSLGHARRLGGQGIPKDRLDGVARNATNKKGVGPMKQRGIFEKHPGSGVYWIRYADRTGRIRREKAGTKSAAITLYRKRQTEVLEGRKLPKNLRLANVSFEEVARDALEYSRTT